MGLLDEIRGYLVAQSTAFQLGESTGANIPVWKGRFPAHATDTAVALFQYGGSSPQYTLPATTAPATPAFQRPAVQVISRSTSYPTGESNARAIYDILKLVTNAALPTAEGSTSTVTYLRILPNQEPFDMGRDGNQREQFSCNYIIEKEPA